LIVRHSEERCDEESNPKGRCLALLSMTIITSSVMNH